MAMVFNGVPAGHPDEDALDIALALLNNNSQTGTMDKLVLDGELTSAGAYTRTFREQGRAIVAAIPSTTKTSAVSSRPRAPKRKP